MGVRFISLADDDTVVAIARNAERAVAADVEELDEAADLETPGGDAEAAGEEGTDE
jgi:hypothetical protein